MLFAWSQALNNPKSKSDIEKDVIFSKYELDISFNNVADDISIPFEIVIKAKVAGSAVDIPINSNKTKWCNYY